MIYTKLGLPCPGGFQALRRVHSFHESVIRNRREYLTDELSSAKQRIESRNQQKGGLDQHRAEIMGILQSHGALEQFSKIQGGSGRLEAEVESLRQGASNLRSSRGHQEWWRLSEIASPSPATEFLEQKQRLNEAILAFEETSKRLYESAGSMTVDETSNGPVFQFPMQGSRSKGIKNMQIFASTRQCSCVAVQKTRDRSRIS